MCEILINEIKHKVEITDNLRITIYKRENYTITIMEMNKNSLNYNLIKKFTSFDNILIICYPDFSCYKELIDNGATIVYITNSDINFNEEMTYQNGYIYSHPRLQINEK